MNADNLDSNTIASVFIGVHLRFQLCNFWRLCKGDGKLLRDADLTVEEFVELL